MLELFFQILCWMLSSQSLRTVREESFLALKQNAVFHWEEAGAKPVFPTLHDSLQSLFFSLLCRYLIQWWEQLFGCMLLAINYISPAGKVGIDKLISNCHFLGHIFLAVLFNRILPLELVFSNKGWERSMWGESVLLLDRQLLGLTTYVRYYFFYQHFIHCFLFVFYRYLRAESLWLSYFLTVLKDCIHSWYELLK